MKIKNGYILRNILDENIVIGIGNEAYMPDCIMSVNETGAFLWAMLEKGATEDELVNALCAEYETTAEIARADVKAFVRKMTEKGLVED